MVRYFHIYFWLILFLLVNFKVCAQDYAPFHEKGVYQYEILDYSKHVLRRSFKYESENYFFNKKYLITIQIDSIQKNKQDTISLYPTSFHISAVEGGRSNNSSDYGLWGNKIDLISNKKQDYIFSHYNEYENIYGHKYVTDTFTIDLMMNINESKLLSNTLSNFTIKYLAQKNTEIFPNINDELKYFEIKHNTNQFIDTIVLSKNYGIIQGLPFAYYRSIINRTEDIPTENENGILFSPFRLHANYTLKIGHLLKFSDYFININKTTKRGYTIPPNKSTNTTREKNVNYLITDILFNEDSSEITLIKSGCVSQIIDYKPNCYLVNQYESFKSNKNFNKKESHFPYFFPEYITPQKNIFPYNIIGFLIDKNGNILSDENIGGFVGHTYIIEPNFYYNFSGWNEFGPYFQVGYNIKSLSNSNSNAMSLDGSCLQTQDTIWFATDKCIKKIETVLLPGEVYVYTNPIDKGEDITIILDRKVYGDVTIILKNQMGQTVYQNTYKLNGTHTITIPYTFNHQHPTMYFGSVTYYDETYPFKVLVR